MDKDTTPRYAPDYVIVAKAGRGAWTCRVKQYLTHPPGSRTRPSWIAADLVALELITEKGSRWFGFDRCYINSELRMVVEGFSARDEVLRKWAVCEHPVVRENGENGSLIVPLAPAPA